MTPEEVKVLLDTVWVLIAAMLVFFMNAGFGLVESGLCRSKNTVNILTKNFVVFALAVVGYWSVGYGLMFGSGHWVGTEGWFLTGLAPTTDGGLPLLAFFFFQLCFAVTAATIVSGAVAERIKIQSFMVFSVLLVAGVYPVVGHWVWGGGWLADAGFVDFAGSSVVHSVGGWAALMGAVMLGPRLGKYDRNGLPQPIPGHNMAFVTLGGLILWLGWFGFNAGSQLAADADAIARICTTTAMAAALGTLAATLWAWRRTGSPDLTLIVNGMLGGLVGVTAGCAFVDLWGAAAIGMVCGVVVVEAVLLFDRIKVDDPVGATSVHLACGVVGTLLVGVLAQSSLGAPWDGLLFGGGFVGLKAQALGVFGIAAFVVPAAGLLWWWIDKTMGLRVSEEDELMGLDRAEMGLPAYHWDHSGDSRMPPEATNASRSQVATPSGAIAS